MWIVRLALRRPYTFVVMGLAILLLGVSAIVTTPTDIFPEIDIPVVSVIWNYEGLTTEDMASRITTFSEYTISSAVSDVRSIESHTYPGVGVIKIYFQPNVNVEAALAQVTAVSQTILRRMPPGAVPPFILQYNASSVPIIQLALSGKTIPEAQLYDYGIYRIRQQVAPIQGITLPLPYGGKPRQIMVDLDPQALLAKSISAADVSNAVNLQNLTLPSGSVKLGSQEYRVSLNSSPDALSALNELPVKVVNGATVYLRDVAHVRDGFAVQTNIVRQDGRRSVLLTVIKKGGASTLTIVKQLKALLPSIRAAAPPGLEVKELFDQSLFVRAAITGVLTEGAIAAVLTGLMILLFLGSWRSTLVVITSIPLSILTSLAVLSAIGQTLNVMTLGGLALAVGILVDDATVEIENIHRNLGMGKRLVQAILDGAQQIATPAFVSTLSICIVFVPVVFLTGPAKYLFTPLAMAVVFAMLASYLLSRTIVPTLVRYLLGAEAHGEAGAGARLSFFGRIHAGFQRQFERLRTSYAGVLETALARRGRVVVVFGVIVVSGAALLPFVGRDFFPEVDTGQFRLHVRAPAGTRIEETEQMFAQVEASIRRQIPKDQIQLIIDNVGQPQPINLAFTDSVTIGPSDGEILVALNPEHHEPTARWMKTLRETLPREFPGVTFFFSPPTSSARS
jgi:multidrug efflux pump subunit AcrB